MLVFVQIAETPPAEALKLQAKKHSTSSDLQNRGTLVEVLQQQDLPEAPVKSPKRHNYSIGICFFSSILTYST
jgi:hypothetical protein